MDLHGLIIIDQVFHKYKDSDVKFDGGMGLSQTAMCFYRGNTVFSIFDEEESEKHIEEMIKLLAQK